MTLGVIGVGSNIEPEKNIPQVLKILNERFEIIAESRFIYTKPVRKTDQNDYINGAVLLKTNLAMNSLKDSLKNIELLLGRKSSPDPHSPRTIDLDIIVWDDKIIDPDLNERDFLRQSVLELLPHLHLGGRILIKTSKINDFRNQ